MGSEQNKRNGLERVGDGAAGYPKQFTVIGPDITVDDLIARFKGTKREKHVTAIILAAWQEQRTKKPPTAAFVNLLRGGVEVPIIVCDLGRDNTLEGEETVGGKKKKCGRNWVIVIEGRQRVLGRRIIDDESKLPKLMIECRYRTFGTQNTALEATIVRCVTAGRVARTFSAKAEDAAALKRSGMGLDDIAPMAEAQDAAEVELLLFLDKCEQEVKDAVDAGQVALREAKFLSTQTPEEQVRLVTRKVAVGPGATRGKKHRDAANAAAPAKPRAKPRAWCEDLAVKSSASEATFSGLDMAAIIRYLQGDASAIHDRGVSDAARALLKAADAAIKGNGGAANDTAAAESEAQVAAE